NGGRAHWRQLSRATLMRWARWGSQRNSIVKRTYALDAINAEGGADKPGVGMATAPGAERQADQRRTGTRQTTADPAAVKKRRARARPFPDCPWRVWPRP